MSIYTANDKAAKSMRQERQERQDTQKPAQLDTSIHISPSRALRPTNARMRLLKHTVQKADLVNISSTLKTETVSLKISTKHSQQVIIY